MLWFVSTLSEGNILPLFTYWVELLLGFTRHFAALRLSGNSLRALKCDQQRIPWPIPA
jgi:hypothetical protein